MPVAPVAPASTTEPRDSLPGMHLQNAIRWTSFVEVLFFSKISRKRSSDCESGFWEKGHKISKTKNGSVKFPSNKCQCSNFVSEWSNWL